MKKKLMIIAAIFLAVLAIIGGIYIFSGYERIEVQTHRHLMDKGYTNNDIATIKVDFPFVKWNLSYNGWTSTVVFVDEPSVKYHFILSDGKITGNGFSGESATSGKLKHLE